MPDCETIQKYLFAPESLSFPCANQIVPASVLSKTKPPAPAETPALRQYKTETATHSAEPDFPPANIPPPSPPESPGKTRPESGRVFPPQKDRQQTSGRWSQTSLRQFPPACAAPAIPHTCASPRSEA